MNLFRQLLQEVADEKNNRLSACLFKAKLLASRLRSRKFKQWVDFELEGYRGQISVPDYRIIHPPLHGDFAGPFWSAVRNVQLSASGLDTEIRNIVDNLAFGQNVGELEGLLESDSEVFHYQWDHSLVELLRRVSGVRIPGMVLNGAESIFTKTSVHGILHAIRKRLLDFLIELAETYPQLEQSDAAAEQIPNEEITRIVEQVIYNNCTITGGQAMANQDVKVGGSVNVGGHFVVAESIRDSFNAASGSAAPMRVKELLGQLAEALKKAAETLPAEKAQEAAQDFETLTKEATKPTPRKPILQTIGNGIVQTVQAAGKLAEPVAVIVSAILKHFGVANAP